MTRNTSTQKNVIVTLIVLIILVAVLPIKEIFLSPTITGMLISKTYIKGQQVNQSCSTTISRGWNLVSFPCLADNTSADHVLSSINSNYTSIFSYDEEDAIDPWKSYNPNIPSWVVNDLEDIGEKKGYWIYMKNESTYRLNGTLTSPNTLTLTEGWNLMGYPSSSLKDITDALSTISGSYTVIWFYNSTNDQYYYYNVTEANGTFDKMIPYYGYWINMSNNDTLFIT